MFKLSNDTFFDVLAEYPAYVVDYCLMKDDAPYRGEASHREAIAFAMESFCAADEDEGPIWTFDASRATAKEITAAELLALPPQSRKHTEAQMDGTEATFYDSPSDVLPYWRAFLMPPHGGCTEAGFARLNAALFPQGTDGLTVFAWSTDWSDYFDDGHEWWGASCWSVYDAKTERYVVIMASATD